MGWEWSWAFTAAIADDICVLAGPAWGYDMARTIPIRLDNKMPVAFNAPGTLFRFLGSAPAAEFL